MDFGAKRYRYYSDVWNTSSRPAILLLLGMLFLGWLMIWILMPTNTFYEIWLPKLHAQTDSTYFGTQGYNSFSFPLRKLYFQLLIKIFIVISTWAAVKNRLSYVVPGTNLLLFTVPILLIAFVGCFYLHFGKKGDNDNKRYVGFSCEEVK